MRYTWLFALALGVLGTTGCGHVESKHPLSTEAGSTRDERLLGFWEPEPKAGAEDAPVGRLLVGRLAGHPKLLEVVWIDLDEKLQVRIQRLVLRCTKLAGAWYLSATGPKPGPEGETYVLLRYEVDDNGTLSMASMALDEVGKAISAKRIAGTVSLESPDPGSPAGEPKYKRATLTASTETLRAWIAKAGSGIWKKSDRALLRVGRPVSREKK